MDDGPVKKRMGDKQVDREGKMMGTEMESDGEAKKARARARVTC